MSIQHPTSKREQPTQTRGWELILRGSFTTYTQTYITTSEHFITVSLIRHSTSSQVRIRVEKNDAFYQACHVTYFAENHEQLSDDFLRDYLASSALEDICRRFDELCTH